MLVIVSSRACNAASGTTGGASEREFGLLLVTGVCVLRLAAVAVFVGVDLLRRPDRVEAFADFVAGFPFFAGADFLRGAMRYLGDGGIRSTPSGLVYPGGRR